jgi:hypothetical protein
MLISLPIIYEDDFVIKWPKNIGIVCIVGFFAIALCFLLPLLLLAFLNGKINVPAPAFIFAYVILLFFGIVVASAFIFSVRNYINPFVRFLANKEGLFLNITFSGKKVFFIPWKDVLQIDKSQIKRSTGKGGSYMIDALEILFESSKHPLPKVLRCVNKSSEGQLHFAYDTLNMDIDTLVIDLNRFREQYEGTP